MTKLFNKGGDGAGEIVRVLGLGTYYTVGDSGFTGYHRNGTHRRSRKVLP